MITSVTITERSVHRFHVQASLATRSSPRVVSHPAPSKVAILSYTKSAASVPRRKGAPFSDPLIGKKLHHCLQLRRHLRLRSASRQRVTEPEDRRTARVPHGTGRGAPRPFAIQHAQKHPQAICQKLRAMRSPNHLVKSPQTRCHARMGRAWTDGSISNIIIKYNGRHGHRETADDVEAELQETSSKPCSRHHSASQACAAWC
jgi:hypothetical protein